MIALESAYGKLKLQFEEMVECDNRAHCAKSVFLPNVVPLAPVDFVLVGSEPSRGTWGRTDEEAREKIAKGFRNFGGCKRCEPLHYCVDQWLCQGSGSYYLTDLAKGAVSGSIPRRESWEKYERWYPLLLDELKLVAKPDATVISIGHNAAGFLLHRGLRGHVGKVPHYAGRSRDLGKLISAFPTKWESFCKEMLELPPGRKVRKVSDTERKWMFDYKVLFERFRPGGNADWRSSLERIPVPEPPSGSLRPPCWTCE